MNEDKITVFLSHSHKDAEKVRKLRDLLEMLDCEPLIFFLKCLDEKNDELEDFIKREIEARNVFLYCKSENAENSLWVQKELEFIRSFDKKRLYEIDIENSFGASLAAFINKIAFIIKSNSLFLSYSAKNTPTVKTVYEYLGESGFKCFLNGSAANNSFFAESIYSHIDKALKEGVFVWFASAGGCSQRSLDELNYALDKRWKYNGYILPVVIKSGDTRIELPQELSDENCVYISEEPTKEELKNLLDKLVKLLDY